MSVEFMAAPRRSVGTRCSTGVDVIGGGFALVRRCFHAMVVGSNGSDSTTLTNVNLLFSTSDFYFGRTISFSNGGVDVMMVMIQICLSLSFLSLLLRVRNEDLSGGTRSFPLANSSGGGWWVERRRAPVATPSGP